MSLTSYSNIYQQGDTYGTSLKMNVPSILGKNLTSIEVNVIVEQALLFFTAQNVFAPGFPKKNFGVKLVTLFW